MRHAHAAADHHVVADDAAGLLDRDEAQVVREHVDVVVRRQCDGDLELPRHIGAAVDRFVFLLAARELFAVDPDLVPGAALRQQMRPDRLRQPRHLGMRAALPRIDARDHVAVHVAAGGDGVEHRVVEAAYRVTQVALDDAVELDGLPRGQPQRAVAAFARDPLRRQPLPWRQDTAGHAQPRHEDERLLHLLASAFGAQVAIVLHVDAVEFGQLLIVVRQRAGLHAGQAIGDGAAQQAAVGLDRFVGRGRALRVHHRAAPVIARSRATKQSPSSAERATGWRLLRRCAPRNDR